MSNEPSEASKQADEIVDNPDFPDLTHKHYLRVAIREALTKVSQETVKGLQKEVEAAKGELTRSNAELALSRLDYQSLMEHHNAEVKDWKEKLETVKAEKCFCDPAKEKICVDHLKIICLEENLAEAVKKERETCAKTAETTRRLTGSIEDEVRRMIAHAIRNRAEERK